MKGIMVIPLYCLLLIAPMVGFLLLLIGIDNASVAVMLLGAFIIVNAIFISGPVTSFVCDRIK